MQYHTGLLALFQSTAATEQLRKKDSTCLLLRVVMNVEAVLRLKRRSTNTESLLTAKRMGWGDRGPMKYISSKVRGSLLMCNQPYHEPQYRTREIFTFITAGTTIFFSLKTQGELILVEVSNEL